MTDFVVDLLVSVGAILFVLAVAVRVMENRFIYFPPRYPEGFSALRNTTVPAEEVWLTTVDGVRINAWFFPDPTSQKVLLWFHGNAENIGYAFEQLVAFARLGANVLAVDYRGYGKSEGSPHEAGLYRDAEAAYRYSLESRKFSPRNIFFYGRSLGGAVAIDLAARHECGGLIVESSFTTGREMARRMFRIPLLEYIPKSRFDSLAKITRVRTPILVVHGADDEVIPFAMGGRLYEAALQPKFFFAVKGAGHNDVMQVGGDLYVENLKAFIDGKMFQPTAGVSAK